MVRKKRIQDSGLRIQVPWGWLVLLLLTPGSWLLTPAFSQQPQAQSGQPIYSVNAKYVQGIGPGYWPTKGTGLVLNLSAGTSFCGSPPVAVNYAGGALTMVNSTTNYVFLDPSVACAPASNTTGFSVGHIPIATVVTAGSAITSVTDLRGWFAPLPCTMNSAGAVSCAALGTNQNIVLTPSGNGNALTNRFEQIRFADQFSGASATAQINAAINDLGATEGVVVIPSTMPTGNATTVPNNIELFDFRPDGVNGTDHWLSLQEVGNPTISEVFPKLAPINLQLNNLSVNQKRGIQVSARTNSSVGTINTGGIGIDIYTPPDNGGDVSGIWVRQTGGGNGIASFALGSQRPTGFTDYPGNGLAFEGQVDENKTVYWAQTTGTGTPKIFNGIMNAAPNDVGMVMQPFADASLSRRAFVVQNAGLTQEKWYVTLAGDTFAVGNSTVAGTLLVGSSGIMPVGFQLNVEALPARFAAGIAIGSGTTITSMVSYSTASITPTAVLAATCSDQTFTVTGLATTDKISNVIPPAALGNISLQAYPSAINTILFHFCNPSAASVSPPAGVYSFLAIR